jgi:hypothetical protein
MDEAGVRAMAGDWVAACVIYDREGGVRVADTVEFDDAGLIRRMVACYAHGVGQGEKHVP